MLCVTANCGTLSSGDLLVSRMKEIESLVERVNPILFVVYFQELGGDEKAAEDVFLMSKTLIKSPALQQYSGTGILFNVDPNFEYSALGTAVFIRDSHAAQFAILDRRLNEFVSSRHWGQRRLRRAFRRFANISK